MAEQTSGAGNTTPAERPPEPRRRRRWLRRLLKVFGVLVLLLVLLVVLLPTIISILPVGKWISGSASDMVPGEILVEDLSLGWFSPVKIDGVVLRDESLEEGSQFLAIKDLKIEGGLLRAILSDNRIGAITIESITVNAVRYENGEFNFNSYIPPSTGEEPPPQPSEPFELDLEKLVPSFPLPLQDLHVAVETVNLSWTDYASSPTVEMALQDARLSADWEGSTQPLTMALTNGTVVSPQGSVPIHWEATLSDWIDTQNQTTLAEADFDSSLQIEQEKALQLTAELGDGAAKWNLELPIAPWVPLARLYPTAAEIPNLDGILNFAGSMVPQQDNLQRIEATLDLRDVVVSGLGTERDRLPVPALHMEAGATIHQQTFARDDVLVALESDLLQFRLEEDRLSLQPPSYKVTASASLKPENLLDYTRDAAFVTEALPELSGDFALELEAVHDESWVQTATALAEWKGDYVRFPSLDLFPPSFQPRDATIDLQPTSFRFELNTEPETIDQIRTDILLTNPLIGLKGDISYTSPLLVNADTVLDVDVTALVGYVKSEFVVEPEFETGGELELALDVTASEEKVVHEGELDLSNFSFSMESMPDFNYEDDLKLAWEGASELEAPFPSTLALRFDDRYTTATVTSAFSTEGVRNAALEAQFRLGVVMNEIVPAFATDLPVAAEGDVLLRATVEQPAPQAYAATFAARSLEDFVVISEEYGLELAEFSASAEARAEMSEERLHATLESSELTLEDFFRAGATGEATMEDSLLTVTAEPTLWTSFAPLLAKLQPYVEENMAMVIDAEGELDTAFALRAVVDMSGEQMLYPEPVMLEATIATALDSLQWEQEEQTAAIFGLNGLRKWEASLDPNNLESLQFTENDETSIEGLMYGEMATIESLSMKTELHLEGTNDVAFDLSALDVGVITYTGDPYSAVLPNFHMETFLTTDLASQTLTLDRLVASSPEVFDFAMSSFVNWNSFAIEAEGKFDVLSFDQALALVEPDVSADYLSDLEGFISSAFNFRADLAQTEQGAYLPESFDGRLALDYGNLTFHMPETVVVRTATGRLSLVGDLDSARFTTNNSADFALLNMPDLPEFKSLHFDSEMELYDTGNFGIEELAIRSEQFGTDMNLRGEIRDARGAISKFTEASTGTLMLDVALQVPAEFYLQYDQEIAPLAETPWLAEGGGRSTLQARVLNIPGQQTNLQFEHVADNISLNYNDSYIVRGLNGSFPFQQPIYHTARSPMAEEFGKGEYFAEDIQVVGAPFDLKTSDMMFVIESLSQRMNLRLLSSSILGATMEFDSSMRLEQENPVLTGTLGVTGLDFAIFYPELIDKQGERRELNGFGTVRWTIPPNPTLAGVLESLVVQIDVAEIGREVLRGVLRSISGEGFNPSIQAALAALRFSRPESGRIEIISGLLNVYIYMISPAGIRYTLPLFERSNLANLMGAYGSPEMDAQLSMLRQSLRILLAGNMQPLREFLTEGEEE